MVPLRTEEAVRARPWPFDMVCEGRKAAELMKWRETRLSVEMAREVTVEVGEEEMS